MTSSRRDRPRRPRLTSAIEFLSVEALGGIALLAATIGALVWANVGTGSYLNVWASELTVGVGNLAISEPLRAWVNDGLMAVFFFVVGLEIKRELVRGELRDPRTASLPVFAAIGGMVVPAALYFALNRGGPDSQGWGIPMATDIAFAVAVLAVLSTRIPSGLKLFVLTLAIVDDIGAILVIAIFYSDSISVLWLAGALGVISVIVLLQRVGIAHPIAYVAPAVALWVCTFESGLHATIAGVVLGLLTPARPFGGREVIEGLEHRLHPWSSFLIVPLFALANAGVILTADSVERAATGTIALGVVVGLVVGKPLGIVTATAIGVRSGLGRLPEGVHRVHVLGAGLLAGIGFTVSLFVASLSFRGVDLDEAKIGILIASIASGVLGAVLLLIADRRPEHPPPLPRQPVAKP